MSEKNIEKECENANETEQKQEKQQESATVHKRMPVKSLFKFSSLRFLLSFF